MTPTGNRKKALIGVCVAAALAIAGFVVFGMLDGGPGADSPAAAERTPAVTPAAGTPANAEDAQLMMEINKAIAEVTAEAMARPKEDRMTAEEINERIRSRIDEIKARQ